MYFFRGIPNHLALLASVRSDTFIYFICATSFHNKVLLLSALQTRLRRRTFGTNTCVCDCAVRQSSPPPMLSYRALSGARFRRDKQLHVRHIDIERALSYEQQIGHNLLHKGPFIYNVRTNSRISDPPTHQ